MKRTRSFPFVLIACAALLGATYVIVLRPQPRQAAALHDQLVSLHAQSNDLMALQDELTAARLLLAQAKEIESFAAGIAQHARQSGLAVAQIRPSPVRTAQECDVVAFELRLTGRFFGLVRLLETLATTGIAYSVENMTIQTDPSTGEGVIHMILETYLLKEPPA
mgnify:CR=1 FL=1